MRTLNVRYPCYRTWWQNVIGRCCGCVSADCICRQCSRWRWCWWWLWLTFAWMLVVFSLLLVLVLLLLLLLHLGRS